MVEASSVSVVGSFEDLMQDQPLPRTGRFLWSVGPVAARALGRLAFSLRIERHGDLPPPPFVIAANHYSHFDAVAIGAAVRSPIRYLAVDELFGNSAIFDRVLGWSGAIPLSRSRVPIRTLRIALARLEAGDILGVFPEGTRVARWGDHAPKRGAAWLATRAKVPLIPVAVTGTDLAFGLDNRLRWAPIRVVVGQPMGPHSEDATRLTAKWESWTAAQLARFPARPNKVCQSVLMTARIDAWMLLPISSGSVLLAQSKSTSPISKDFSVSTSPPFLSRTSTSSIGGGWTLQTCGRSPRSSIGVEGDGVSN